MKSAKRLVLRRQVITELTAGDLRRVEGGNSGRTCPCVTTVHLECPSDPIMGCTVVTVTRFETCIC